MSSRSDVKAMEYAADMLTYNSRKSTNAEAASMKPERGKSGRTSVQTASPTTGPILRERPVVATAEEQARMLQSEDVAGIIVYVAEAPQHVCVNEILISPTHNRGYIAHTGL